MRLRHLHLSEAMTDVQRSMSLSPPHAGGLDAQPSSRAPVGFESENWRNGFMEETDQASAAPLSPSVLPADEPTASAPAENDEPPRRFQREHERDDEGPLEVPVQNTADLLAQRIDKLDDQLFELTFLNSTRLEDLLHAMAHVATDSSAEVSVQMLDGSNGMVLLLWYTTPGKGMHIRGSLEKQAVHSLYMSPDANKMVVGVRICELMGTLKSLLENNRYMNGDVMTFLQMSESHIRIGQVSMDGSARDASSLDPPETYAMLALTAQDGEPPEQVPVQQGWDFVFPRSIMGRLARQCKAPRTALSFEVQVKAPQYNAFNQPTPNISLLLRAYVRDDTTRCMATSRYRAHVLNREDGNDRNKRVMMDSNMVHVLNNLNEDPRTHVENLRNVSTEFPATYIARFGTMHCLGNDVPVRVTVVDGRTFIASVDLRDTSVPVNNGTSNAWSDDGPTPDAALVMMCAAIAGDDE